MSWADGVIEIRVDADFLAFAAAPLTIDPMITALPIDLSAADDALPDVAYDASMDVYALCWERFFSASDRDIHGAILDGTGAVLREYLIDASPISLREPKIAGIDALDRFLVATVRVGTTWRAEARLLTFPGGVPAVGPPVTVITNYVLSLDLGGDAGTTPPYRFCLAAGWDFGGCRSAVYYLLSEDGTLIPGAWGSFGDCDDNYAAPKVSKNARGPSGEPRCWAYAFEYIYISFPDEVLDLRIEPDGSWTDLVTLSPSHVDRTAAVSSFLETESGPLTHLALYRRELPTGPDKLYGRVVRGTHACAETLDERFGGGE